MDEPKILTWEEVDTLHRRAGRPTHGQVNRHDNDGGDVNWQVQIGVHPDETYANTSDFGDPQCKWRAEMAAASPMLAVTCLHYMDRVAELEAEVERLRQKSNRLALDLAARKGACDV